MLEKQISDKKYFAFLKVRDSGLTNMFMIPEVIRLAKTLTGIKLTKDDCIQIMKNFDELEKLYNKQS